MITRRQALIATGAFALSPVTALAQQINKVWRVGFLSQRSRPDDLELGDYGGFVLGMRDLGYVEGKNLEIEWRFSEGKAERLPSMVAELLRLKVDILVTASSGPTHAAQKGAPTIPIVMVGIADPVGNGFVKTLARPGGNITGLSNLSADLTTKQVEMLVGMVPKLSRIAVMINPESLASPALLRNVRAAAHKSGLTILDLGARTPQEIESGVTRMAREKVGALIVMRDPNIDQQVRLLAQLAATNRLPSIGGMREYAEAGGLMSYGTDRAAYYRRAATYVEKILKGAKPGDLPVEQPTTFDLVINMKTAKALGLKVPQSILVQATKVIE